MKRLIALVTLLGVVSLTATVWAEVLPTARPEQVGLSSERLERLSRALRGEIEAGKKEDMISVLMTQGAPGPARGYTSALFRQMVRQAIVE